jgi:hypothetical protein
MALDTRTDVRRHGGAAGVPPIVTVGTSGDPATPYPSSVSVARHPSSSSLLTNVGDTHTAHTGFGGP